MSITKYSKEKDTWCDAPLEPLIFGRTFNEFLNESTIQNLSIYVNETCFVVCSILVISHLFTSVLCCFRFSIHIEECTKNYEKNSYRCLFQIFHLTRLPNSQRMKNYLQTFQWEAFRCKGCEKDLYVEIATYIDTHFGVNDLRDIKAIKRNIFVVFII